MQCLLYSGMTVVLSSTLLCISFTYKIAIPSGPLLLHVICSLVAEDAEAAYYAQRAEEARFDRTKNKLKTKMFLLEEEGS